MRAARIIGLAVGMLAVLGCSARTDKTDSGGLTLTIQSFDFSNLSDPISASASFPSVIGNSIVLKSIVLNPGQGTSDLMKVEIQGYEVTYERLDTGTRIPPRLVESIFGTIDPGGTYTLTNGTLVGLDQFNNQPFKDLLEFGKDPQTNNEVIRLKVGIRFFGRTISGDSVESNVGYITLNFVG